jgi:hypothetical protein
VLRKNHRGVTRAAFDQVPWLCRMRAPDHRYHPKLREQLACYRYADPLSQNLEPYVPILNRSITELLSGRAVLADGVVPPGLAITSFQFQDLVATSPQLLGTRTMERRLAAKLPFRSSRMPKIGFQPT